MIQESAKIYNPIWWPGLIIGTIWASLVMMVAMIWVWFDRGYLSMDWLDIAVGSLLWLLVFFVAGFGGEVVYRPKYVQITETGVVMYYRITGKVRELPWWKIMDITIPLRKGPLESGRDGSVGITRRTRWLMTNEILYIVREKYIEKMGKEPLNLRVKG
jgi:hypothetical protein